MKTIRRSGVRLAHGLVSVLLATTVVCSMTGIPTADTAPPLGAGEGGPQNSRKGTVWVVNRDKGTLAIFDATDGTVLETLVVGAGAHDVCISERAGKAYVTAETINMVTAVDIETLATESIPVSPLPHHCEPSHDGRILYVTLASHSMTVGAPQYAAIDTTDHSVSYVTTSSNPAARAHAPYPSLDGEPSTWHTMSATRSRASTPRPAHRASSRRSRGPKKPLPPGLEICCGCRRAATAR